MDAPEPSRRRLFDLPVIAILAVLAVVACLVVWKWTESYNRKRCVSDLAAKGVVLECVMDIDAWSTEWPFHNVERAEGIVLFDGTYDRDDVRRLRRTFPGVPIHHDDHLPGSWSMGPRPKVPED